MQRLHTDSDDVQGNAVGPMSFAAVEPEVLQRARYASKALQLVKAPFRKRRKMSVHEELFLNPFEKWFRYGRFPTMFFVHAVLVLLVTCQVMYYLQRDITHACQAACHFSSLFLGTPSGSVTLWQPGELQDALENAVQNIFEINDVTFNDVIYTRRGLAALQSPDPREQHRELGVFLRYRNASTCEVKLTREAFVNEASGKVKKYLEERLPILYNRDIRHLQELFIGVDLLETVHELPAQGHFLWRMLLRFDGRSVGRFVATLTYSLDSSVERSAGWFWQDRLVMAFATFSILLILRKLIRSFRVLLRLRRAAAQASAASSVLRLSWKDELALFSWWWGVSAFCNVFQIVASAACLRRTTDVVERFSLLGWSCCFTWLNICQYLEFFPGYYVTFSTTAKGMANVVRYMASVVPILTAFMFLGTCQFWQAKTFQGVSASYASLFSLLNGDMVHDAFVDLGNVAGWCGHLYLYVFIFIFIYIVLNVNITIIEEAYYSAHFQGLKHEEQARIGTGTTLTSNHLFSRCTSEEPEAAAALLYDMDDGTGPEGSGSDRSEACWGPNTSDARNVTPLLSRSDKSAPRMTQILARGSLSPRILDNPKLQGALAAVFTPRPVSFFSDGRTPIQRGDGPAGANRAAASEASPTAASCPDAGVIPGPEWWLVGLPRLTQLLRCTPLPSRSEVSRWHEGWQRLEKAVAEHQAALDEVSATLYREVSKT